MIATDVGNTQQGVSNIPVKGRVKFQKRALSARDFDRHCIHNPGVYIVLSHYVSPGLGSQDSVCCKSLVLRNQTALSSFVFGRFFRPNIKEEK